MNNSIFRSLVSGANVTGTFIEGYHYVEEDLPINKSEEALEFCKWIDENIGGASIHNIRILYKAFKNPTDKELCKYTNELKEQISYFKSF
jgi:hypothetical protein